MESQDREVIELRRRIAWLRDEAKRNEDAWKRSQQREMELLEADTLPILLERLTQGLQQSYRLTAATLVLADPHHEIRHLLMAQGDHAREHSAVLFVDSAHALAPAARRGPPSVARTIRSSRSRVAVSQRELARKCRPPAFDPARKNHRQSQHGQH